MYSILLLYCMYYFVLSYITVPYDAKMKDELLLFPAHSTDNCEGWGDAPVSFSYTYNYAASLSFPMRSLNP